MALYSEKVMDHFRNPRNVGVIENADGVGEVGNAKCGDIMKIYLKIENDIIADVKFETFGCWKQSPTRNRRSRISRDLRLRVGDCFQLHGDRAHQGEAGGGCLGVDQQSRGGGAGRASRA